MHKKERVQTHISLHLLLSRVVCQVADFVADDFSVLYNKDLISNVGSGNHEENHFLLLFTAARS